jgi:hypothetical protein
MGPSSRMEPARTYGIFFRIPVFDGAFTNGGFDRTDTADFVKRVQVPVMPQGHRTFRVEFLSKGRSEQGPFQVVGSQGVTGH